MTSKKVNEGRVFYKSRNLNPLDWRYRYGLVISFEEVHPIGDKRFYTQVDNIIKEIEQLVKGSFQAKTRFTLENDKIFIALSRKEDATALRLRYGDTRVLSEDFVRRKFKSKPPLRIRILGKARYYARDIVFLIKFAWRNSWLSLRRGG